MDLTINFRPTGASCACLKMNVRRTIGAA